MLENGGGQILQRIWGETGGVDLSRMQDALTATDQHVDISLRGCYVA